MCTYVRPKEMAAANNVGICMCLSELRGNSAHKNTEKERRTFASRYVVHVDTYFDSLKEV